jgi:carboxyl-terminal processing protease
MSTDNRKKTMRIVGAIFAIALLFAFGLYVGYSYGTKTTNTNAFSIFSIFDKDKTKEDVDLSSFWKAWSVIDEKYPGASEITKEKRVEGAIAGLINSIGDPYSEFFNPDEKELFESEVEGSFRVRS